MTNTEIAMEWDGKTPEAKLIFQGKELTGLPDDVQDVFDRLNQLQCWCGLLEKQLEQIASVLDDGGFK